MISLFWVYCHLKYAWCCWSTLTSHQDLSFNSQSQAETNRFEVWSKILGTESFIPLGVKLLSRTFQEDEKMGKSLTGGNLGNMDIWLFHLLRISDNQVISLRSVAIISVQHKCMRWAATGHYSPPGYWSSLQNAKWFCSTLKQILIKHPSSLSQTLFLYTQFQEI